ncbi:MAG TPA: poly-beta-hydroxybutyrate polymerase, partial [Alphaproteobacteria bacterium]|nr:poly-beta-hydroxybutyrate polymerase [Alphaproteobacteria bacterium]
AQSHFALEDWWRSATTNIRGLRPHHSDQVSFLAQQMLDFVAPCNFPWSNPRILRAAMSSGGRSLALGARNLVEDISRRINREPSPA